MNKYIFTLFLIALIVSNLIAVSAITGSIGNARMVLRAEKNDVIEKYILVKNVNNESVNIEISASGDLADYIDIKDKSFTLAAGEEKKAYFTIEVKKEGTTETKINVQFAPQEGKSGVGLSSTVIVIAGGEGSLDEETNNENSSVTDNNSSITGNVIGNFGNKYLTALSITGITAIVFVIILIIYYTKFKKSNKKEIKQVKIKLKKRSEKK